MSNSDSAVSLGEDYELTDKNDDSFVFTLDIINRTHSERQSVE